jgi:hypothetical protein
MRTPSSCARLHSNSPGFLRSERGRSIRSWNIFGALDLFAAVGFGLTTAQGSPLQILHVGAGSAAMQFLPFALVPTVLVPFYLITHGIVAAQLATRRRSQKNDNRRHKEGAAVLFHA